MNDQITFNEEVIGGHLSNYARQKIAETLAKFEGKRVSITIAKFVKIRSSNQNRFMHGPFFKAIKAAHAEAGEILSPDAVKELFKKAFGLRETIRGIDRSEVEILKSTKKYSTIECEEAMEKARAEYAQYGHYLPFPNENLCEKAKQ